MLHPPTRAEDQHNQGKTYRITKRACLSEDLSQRTYDAWHMPEVSEPVIEELQRQPRLSYCMLVTVVHHPAHAEPFRASPARQHNLLIQWWTYARVVDEYCQAGSSLSHRDQCQVFFRCDYTLLQGLQPFQALQVSAPCSSLLDELQT